MVVSRKPSNINTMRAENYEIEKIDDFNFLGVNSENDLHIEINKRIVSGS